MILPLPLLPEAPGEAALALCGVAEDGLGFAVDLCDELPVDDFVIDLDDGATGSLLWVGLLVDVEGEMAGLDETKVVEVGPLVVA